MLIDVDSLLMHDHRGDWVQHIFVLLCVANTENLVAEDPRGRVKLLVFHKKVTFAADALIGSLNWVDFATEDWQSDMLGDQVRVWTKLNQISVDVRVTELGDKSFLYDSLILGFMVCDL